VATHRNFLSKLSLACGVKIFTIDYRLSPETKFPGALDDSVAAYKWLISKDGGGVDPKNIIIGGDSAGGGLAVSTLLQLRNLREVLPSGCILLSPWVDLTLSTESVTENVIYDYLLVHPNFPKLYVEEESELKNPLVSPIFADLHGLPRLLVQVGGVEVLRDEGIELANKAKEANVEVQLEIWPEMVHCFQLLGQLLKDADVAIGHIADWMKDAKLVQLDTDKIPWLT